MKHAISELECAYEMYDTNYEVYSREGNHEEAERYAILRYDMKAALDVLKAFVNNDSL